MKDYFGHTIAPGDQVVHWHARRGPERGEVLRVCAYKRSPWDRRPGFVEYVTIVKHLPSGGKRGPFKSIIRDFSRLTYIPEGRPSV